MVSITNFIPKSSASDTFDIKVWVDSISTDRSKTEQQSIIEACTWAKQFYHTKTQISGEPYITHLISVANILVQMGMDTDVLIAAILHDISLEKPIVLDYIETCFGAKVLHLLKGVAKMKFIEEINDNNAHKTSNRQLQIEKLRKMLLAMAEDVRVVLIKLAERLDNMRFLSYLSEDKQRSMARETLDLFAPLANRLGIWQIKWELEDLSLRYLEPHTYKKLARLLDERRIDRETYIEQVVKSLSDALLKANIKAEVSGRPKHIYSIWRKMQKKACEFNEIFDVRAVRVLVNTVSECYTTLGIVHNKWQPLPKEFDDYIAQPKNNNYQSLHTAVIGPERKFFEVQIRTKSMHHDSELGVASHWRYKEANSQQDKNFEDKIAWLRQMLEWKKEDGDFIDHLKSEIFEERVYVLSPHGEVIDLPQGATPLDFAYYIHTQLGHCCRGAKINHRIVPLTYTLKSGDMVDILRRKVEKPSRDWLIQSAGYLKTSRARSRLRQWFKKQDIQQHITNGRALLERLFQHLHFKDSKLESLAKNLHFQSVEQFLSSVGRGDTTTHQISNFFKKTAQNKPKEISVITEPAPKTGEIYIKGISGLLTQIAGCCQPVPHDLIVGYISKGRGVIVHRYNCSNVLRWQNEGNERLIEVEWNVPTI